MLEETQAVNSGNDGATNQETPDSNVSDSGANNAPGDGSQGGSDAPANEGRDDDNSLFVKGDDGKEYIPKEAFEARIAKLSAQKNEARNLLEAIKSDPNVRREFMESLNIGEERTASSEGDNEPSPFEAFLAPLPSEHQAHYRNMGTAIAQEVQSYVQEQLKQALTPIKSWIGSEKVKSFASTNKDFDRYQGEIEKIMSEGRAQTVEDAYVLASYRDKMKGAQQAGQKEELERRQRIARVPMAGRGVNGAATRNGKPLSLRDALNKAGQEHGYTG